MAAERTGRVWEEVRRALGRLAGRIASHDLPEAQAGIAVSVRHAAAFEFADAEAGARQAECQPSAQVRGLPSPAAVAGQGGVDLAAVATVIGANQAIGASEASISTIPCRFEAPPVHAWSLERDMPSAPAVHETVVQFLERPVQSPGIVLENPAIRGLPVVRVSVSKSKQDSTPAWRFGAARIRADLSSILRVPITSTRLLAPPGVASSVAFAPERLLLAASASVPETDLALIGVFPHVPLGVVLKLAVVSDGTALQIWVRPEAARRGTSIATVTVVLGRQRSTGKMLQAVRRGSGSRPR